MKSPKTDRGPWTPAALFINGALWALIGVVLVNAGDIAPVGYALVLVGAVHVLIGAIRVGTANHGPTTSD
ncbi:hypothetical protein [Aeromicrobium endophyticum]|uniref:hypothetical protein n=1 Tax=Aeromicrobium endophyticum TaxID=2292704 RepID=UPI0013148324|nr:hypothetical protein [Aeromicrobium endophyticum]